MSDESWRHIEDAIWARIAWSRIHCSPFDRKTAAAKSMGLKPGTYRTYEIPKADGGREPERPILQQIARKYGVSWVWMLTGEGSPSDKDEPTPVMVVSNEIAADIEQVPEDKREDALRAAKAVIAAFKQAV